jgi:transglutaminase-like putative cysteine protease
MQGLARETVPGHEADVDWFHCPTCRQASPSSRGRRAAIRSLVRPDEVVHIARVAADDSAPTAEQVAGWLRLRFTTGELRLLCDPPGARRWWSPAETLRRGGGDCDDLAVLGASILAAAGGSAYVAVGSLCDGRRCSPHAWVEGMDESGGFFLEPTFGLVLRGARPPGYHLMFAELGFDAPGG